jgi:hypothetical protein
LDSRAVQRLHERLSRPGIPGDPRMKKAKHVPRTHPVRMDLATTADDRDRFAPRLGRALLLLCVAITTHVWLVRAPQGDSPRIRLPRAATPAVAQAGVSFAPVASQPRTVEPAAKNGNVQVKTEFVKVPAPVSFGIVPRETPDRSASAADVPVGTSGFTARVAAPVRARMDTPVRARMDTPPDTMVASTAQPVLELATIPPAAAASVVRLSLGDASARAASAAPAPPAMAHPETAAAAASNSAVRTAVADSAAELEKKEEETVRNVLREYTLAFERLDVQAAKAIRPSLDDRALQRAFQQLDGQQLRLGSCGVSVSGRHANAQCRGDATYRPKVGTRVMTLREMEWTFSLSRENDKWQIMNAIVQ